MDENAGCFLVALGRSALLCCGTIDQEPRPLCLCRNRLCNGSDMAALYGSAGESGIAGLISRWRCPMLRPAEALTVGDI